MRIAVFTNQFPGRVSTFFARDMRGLKEAGIDIEIFPIYPLDPTLWRYVPQILNETIFPRTKVHHLRMSEVFGLPKRHRIEKASRFIQDTASIAASAATFGIGPTMKSAYVFLGAWAMAQKFKGDYDHILSYWGSYAATYAYLVHRLTDQRIPFSTLLHAADLYQDQVYLRKKLLYADKIFVVCDFNRRYLLEKYSDTFEQLSNKIHLHHLGLDLVEYAYEPDRPGSRMLLGVGNFDKCKGFDYLIRAAHRLVSKGIDVHVDLIGQGAEAGSLMKLTTRLGMQDRVNFRGWLRPDEVRNAMRTASLLIHPSSELGDAVPTVIKEAIALGTPVIASDVAGIPELLDNGRCGILVPPRDEEALVRSIESLLFDKAARRRYTDAARKYAEEKFDVWRNGQRLAEILRSTKREPSSTGRYEGKPQ